MAIKQNSVIRFRRLATHRTIAIIKYIRLLGNLSNKQQYECSEKEIKKIFSTLRHELDICEARFKQEIKRPIKFEL